MYLISFKVCCEFSSDLDTMINLQLNLCCRGYTYTYMRAHIEKDKNMKGITWISETYAWCLSFHPYVYFVGCMAYPDFHQSIIVCWHAATFTFINMYVGKISQTPSEWCLYFHPSVEKISQKCV